jgi:NitT/TauT family transport system ATP-binding protein
MTITCQNLCIEYETGNGGVSALFNTSFELHPREFLCIVGPSGCGKTTLLKVLAGLLRPTSGRIDMRSSGVNGSSYGALVFQEHGLFPWLSVLDNVVFGLEMQGVAKEQRYQQAMEFIEQFGLSSFEHNYPNELSVGMRQRVSLARAFLMNSELLLMDEPFASLDALTKVVMQEELLRIWRDHQKQVIYITHDIEEALLMGDRVLVMSGRPGRILEDITVPLERPRDLLNRAHPAVAELKSHIWTILESEVRKSLGGRADG